MKNSRGKDQLRALDVKKFEMECDESTYKNALESLRKSLPGEISSVWDTVVVNASNDKIYGEDTPQPSTPGSGYKTASNNKSSKSTGNKKNTKNTNTSTNENDVSQGLEEMYVGGDTLSLPTGSTDEEMSNIGLTAEQRAELERIARERSAGDAGSGNYTYNGSGTYGVR
jgi:hypothetical protein